MAAHACFKVMQYSPVTNKDDAIMKLARRLQGSYDWTMCEWLQTDRSYQVPPVTTLPVAEGF